MEMRTTLIEVATAAVFPISSPLNHLPLHHHLLGLVVVVVVLLLLVYSLDVVHEEVVKQDPVVLEHPHEPLPPLPLKPGLSDSLL